MTAWILVSDLSRAKLFTAELREDPWTLLQEFDHPQGREFSREIRPGSPPGRMQQSRGNGARAAMEPHTTPKEAEAERFARHLAEFLENAQARRQFDHVTLVAPPHLLGLLHAALGRQTTKHLRAMVDKDYVSLNAQELYKRLIEHVFPLAVANSA